MPTLFRSGGGLLGFGLLNFDADRSRGAELPRPPVARQIEVLHPVLREAAPSARPEPFQAAPRQQARGRFYTTGGIYRSVGSQSENVVFG